MFWCLNTFLPKIQYSGPPTGKNHGSEKEKKHLSRIQQTANELLLLSNYQLNQSTLSGSQWNVRPVRLIQCRICFVEQYVHLSTQQILLLLILPPSLYPCWIRLQVSDSFYMSSFFICMFLSVGFLCICSLFVEMEWYNQVYLIDRVDLYCMHVCCTEKKM